MQTAAAFVQVQVALNWLFDNYPAHRRVAGLGRAVSPGFGRRSGKLDASVGDRR